MQEWAFDRTFIPKYRDSKFGKLDSVNSDLRWYAKWLEVRIIVKQGRSIHYCKNMQILDRVKQVVS